MQRCSQLRILKLCDNQMTSLNDGLFSLASVSELDASSNRLNILQDIQRMQGLRELRLEGNQLRLLPDDMCELSKLQYLDVSKNRLVRLPLKLSTIRDLQEFR